MENAKVDYLMDIFRKLSTELPEQMLYRETGDSIELRIPESIGSNLPAEPESSWSLIGCRMIEAA